MIGYEELIRRRAGLETLQASPCHVLDGQQGTVGVEEEVKITVPNEGIVGVLNYPGKDTVIGRSRGLVRKTLVVGAVAEDVLHRALHPIGAHGRINGCLYIRPVEVDHLTGRRIVARVDNAKNIPEMRTGVGDVIDIETGVRQHFGVEDIVKDVTRCVVQRIGICEDGESPLRRWECEVLLEVGRVTAVSCTRIHDLEEGVVQIHQVLPIMYVGRNHHLLLIGRVTNDGVIDGHSGEIVVLRVVGANESIGDIRHVETSITLSGDVNLVILQSESRGKLLVEADELLGQLNFIRDVGYPLSVSNANWLFHPDHVGQVDPSVGVLDRVEGASFPGKWTILSQQTAQRTTPWATIEPDIAQLTKRDTRVATRKD